MTKNSIANLIQIFAEFFSPKIDHIVHETRGILKDEKMLERSVK
ncbi:unknown protein [Simkania negevensis Z]|uniref:Uncharacterized protein n=1 Tax=Simkania negevensis (strain ATCC VR-1471 / DSM 27360 / Z) TaxID=331113 RepID=F8L718_SIMNZ|nr:unknown protein [Simkania negevensis Z]